MILFDHLAFNQEHGGVPKYFTKLFTQLDKEGQGFLLSIYFTNNIYIQTFLKRSCNLGFLRRFPGYVRLLRIIGYFYSIYFFLSNRSAVTIYHPTHYSFYLFPWVYLFGQNISVVSTIHDMNNWTISPYYPIIDIRKWRQYVVMRFSHRLVCVSQSTANDIGRLYPQWRDKIVVIEHGVSYSVDFSKSDREKSILYVGARNSYKGFNDVIYTLKALKKTIRPELWIVGRTLSEDEKRSLFDLEIDYKLMAGLSDDELRIVYRRCGCFIYPSYGEGFGLPLLDAYSQGSIVVGRNIPVFKEVMNNQMRYFENQTDLIEILIDIFGDDNYKKYDVIDPRNILKYYTWTNSGIKHIKMYQSL